jgi:putative glutamine amidotransferase
MQTDIDHASDPSSRNRHDVTVSAGTKLASIIGAGQKNVNSSHHQAIKDVARGLRVTAHAPDGVVEGLEDAAHPFYIGVQWHPEDMAGEQSASTLFGAFIEAAKRHSEEKRRNSTELSPAAATAAE